LLEDRYRVLREIGRGGMGIVYEAEHLELGKRVAVKLMLEKYAGDKEAVARFRREALAASRIGDPHIIDVSHIGVAPDGRAFVAMELLSGQPLSQVIATAGALAPARAINIMRQVLRAVGAAHAKGIVHRDLKPDNIFLLDHGDGDFVKLLDFGISKMMDGEAAVAATRLTTTGMVMGTPLYMAPEQAMGSVIDHHADLYACGVILYEMLSGRPPFEGATYPVLIAKLLTAEPTNLRELQPHLPAKLVAATHRALEKEPERRFDSAEEFVAAMPSLDRSPSSVELAGTVGVGMPSQSLRVATPAIDSVRRTGGPAPAKSSRAWLWAVVGVAVVGAGAATFVVVKGQTAGNGAAAAAAQPPAGSAVTATPLPAGSAAQVAAVTPAAGSAAAASADKAAGSGSAAPAPGRLELKSAPVNAKVTIDGVAAGVTNLEVTVLPGKHHIHVELRGFAPIDEDEDVEPGSKDTVVFPLQRAQGGGGARPVASAVTHNVQHGLTPVSPYPPVPSGGTTAAGTATVGPSIPGDTMGEMVTIPKPAKTDPPTPKPPTKSKPNPYDDNPY
jgi:serine/threonine-protein kinase